MAQLHTKPRDLNAHDPDFHERMLAWASQAQCEIVNGTLNLTRVCNDRQFESDPPVVIAVLPASGKNGGQTFSSSLVFAFTVCGLAMMPARRLSLSR